MVAIAEIREFARSIRCKPGRHNDQFIDLFIFLSHHLQTVNMTLNLSEAAVSDCYQIAAIHMAAFDSNAMLLAQFPSPSVRKSLERCIAQKALDDIKDSNIAVLVVRNEQGKIISFAKWSLPILSETHIEAPWRWPEGTNLDILDAWTDKKVKAAKHKKILGDQPYYSQFPLILFFFDAMMIHRWASTGENCQRLFVISYISKPFIVAHIHS